jgi:hypothetical protein
MAEPRDIALAIRLKSESATSQEGGGGSKNERHEVEQDGLEDLFDEIGMEYLDEGSLPEDDDERRESYSSSYPPPVSLSLAPPSPHDPIYPIVLKNSVLTHELYR